MAENTPVEGEVVSQTTPVYLTKHPEDTVRLLEAAFNNMFNITEACQYAGISRETYYQWLADDDVFSFRMSVAQQAPNKKAKENILKALQEGDTNVSRWYLERKDPDFKNKAELSVDPTHQQTRDKIKDFLNDKSRDDVGEQPTTANADTGTGDVATTPTDIS